MVQQALDALRSQFLEAMNRFDGPAVASCYTEDAKFMCPNVPLVTGRAGIQEFVGTAREVGMRALHLEAAEVVQEGDLAYEVGRYTADVEMGGQLGQDVGKYVVILRRQSDGWKIAVDIFNSDSPPPGQ